MLQIVAFSVDQVNVFFLQLILQLPLLPEVLISIQHALCSEFPSLHYLQYQNNQTNRSSIDLAAFQEQNIFFGGCNISGQRSCSLHIGAEQQHNG